MRKANHKIIQMNQFYVAHIRVFSPLINRLGSMSESPNLVSLFLGDEAKPRKVLRLPVNSLIARQWPNQDKNQASWFLPRTLSTTHHVKLFFNTFSFFLYSFKNSLYKNSALLQIIKLVTEGRNVPTERRCLYLYITAFLQMFLFLWWSGSSHWIPRPC